MMKKKELSLRTKLKNWSKAVRDRDGNKCVLCGSTDHVQAHHLMPKKFWKDYRFELNNGISLCAKHHSFGKWSIHKGVGDYALFCFLEKYRPDQWNWFVDTIIFEFKVDAWRGIVEQLDGKENGEKEQR